MRKLLIALLAISAAAFAVSCDKLSGGEVLDPYSQKDEINEVGENLIRELELSNWKAVANKINHAMDALDDICAEDGFDSSVLEEWGEDIGEMFANETYDYDHGRSYCVGMIRLSQINGHFTQGDNEWIYKKADDFSISYKDGSKLVEAKMNAKDSSTPILVFKDAIGSGYWEDGPWITNYDISAYMPKEVNLVIKIDGETVVSSSLSMNFSDKGKNNVLDEKDAFSIESTTTFGDYKAVESLSASLQSINAKSSLNHGSKTVYSTTLSLGDIKTTAHYSGENSNLDYLEDMEIDDLSIGRLSFNVDFLGQMQVEVKSSSLSKLNDYLNDLLDAETTDEAQRLVKKIEGLYESGVYFGNKKKQSTIGLEVLEDNYYDNDWWVEPVFRFEDGSSYADFESFFNERDFRYLISDFERFIEDIEDYLDL